jgi:hypothetical protein
MNRKKKISVLGQGLFRVSKQVVVYKCEAVASRDKANEVEPRPNKRRLDEVPAIFSLMKPLPDPARYGGGSKGSEITVAAKNLISTLFPKQTTLVAQKGGIH